MSCSLSIDFNTLPGHIHNNDLLLGPNRHRSQHHQDVVAVHVLLQHLHRPAILGHVGRRVFSEQENQPSCCKDQSKFPPKPDQQCGCNPDQDAAQAESQFGPDDHLLLFRRAAAKRVEHGADHVHARQDAHDRLLLQLADLHGGHALHMHADAHGAVSRGSPEIRWDDVVIVSNRLKGESLFCSLNKMW